MWTHSKCAWYKNGESDIFPNFTQGLNFTRSLFSVLLFIYILPQVTDIFLLMIANVYLYVCILICCMPTVILLYWLILWFTNRSELTSIKGSINQSICNKIPAYVLLSCFKRIKIWWRYDMETIAALLAMAREIHGYQCHSQIQWNLSVTTTSIIRFITCDLFSNVL